MPKYLFRGSYSAQGAEGLLKEGGSGRAAAAEEMAASVGGTVESNYWAFGDTDFFLIVDLPDDAAAAALSLRAGASGAISVTTTKLMSAAEVDEAIGRAATYRAPGA